MPRTETLDRILADLQAALEDPDDEPWSDVVEDAMNTAWDRMLALGGPAALAVRMAADA